MNYRLKNKAENLDLLKKIFNKNGIIEISEYFYLKKKNLLNKRRNI